MKALYEKSELTLTLILVGIFAVGQSFMFDVNKLLGVGYSGNMLLCAALTAVLVWFVCKNGLQQKYGLCRLTVPAKKLLWFIPLAVLASRNLWLGASQNLVGAELVCYLIYMLLVGFVEEILFRGMLFRALEKDNRKTAVIVSSVTFGLGHVINMINGVNTDLLAGVLQVVGAIAIGYLFVTIFERGGSLWPCIIAHSAIDVVSAFANEQLALAQPLLRVLLTVSLYVIVGLYVWHINRALPGRQAQSAQENA